MENGQGGTDGEILLFDKPAGISSFGVVAKVRHELTRRAGHKVKVGHTGTLDPFATGLMILMSGKATKRSNEFLKKDKVYEATICLGKVSSTGDPEGEITPYDQLGFGLNSDSEESDGFEETGFSDSLSMFNDAVFMSRPSYDEVEAAVERFVGVINQKVPQYSAVKIDGQRAYKLARAGKDFETPTRQVTIYEIEILSYEWPELKIRCHVSSGTYIRTLGEDIGEKLGVGGYLTQLRRIRIGKYDVKDAMTLEEFCE
jgi:tRNA pseudouridine55 synthase